MKIKSSSRIRLAVKLRGGPEKSMPQVSHQAS